MTKKNENEVRSTVERLIDRGSNYDVDELEKLYHPDLNIVKIDNNGRVETFSREQNMEFFRNRQLSQSPPLSTEAQFNYIYADEVRGHVLVTRQMDMTGVLERSVFSIELVKSNGNWQIYRETAFVQPLKIKHPGKPSIDLNQVTIQVNDIAKSKKFYTLLGLNLIVDSPHYARFECSAGNTTFSLDVSETVIPGTTTVYLECENLDATVASLSQRGVQFEELPTDKPWLWREAYLRDPDGYRICLFHAGENRLNPPWRVSNVTLAAASPDQMDGIK